MRVAPLWALLALTLAACAPLHDDPIADQWRSIDVQVTPVDFGAPGVGRLAFRGGVVLASDAEGFGGFSGIEVLDENRFLIVSDRANWFDGRLVLDQSGALVGVADMRMAAIRDDRGAPMQHDKGDAEGLTQLPDGRFAVSFEAWPGLAIYDFNRDGPFGAARLGPALAGAEALPQNASLEALASTAGGQLLVGGEGGGGPTPLWRTPLDATAPAPVLAQYVLTDGFSLTSLDRLPNGDFVALERFYAPVVGARARITTFAASELVEGALIHPRRLAQIAPPMPVDNFEGVAAVRMPDGKTRIYIVSDDNMSARQRTLLLAFDVE